MVTLKSLFKRYRGWRERVAARKAEAKVIAFLSHPRLGSELMKALKEEAARAELRSE